MRKYIMLALLVAGSMLQLNAQGKYEIKGSITGIEDGNVYLFRRQMTDLTKSDTLGCGKVENGKFSFSGEIESPCMVSLVFDNVSSWFKFILEPATISISTAKVGKAYKNTEVTGGKGYHNQVFNALKFLDTDVEYQKLNGIRADFGSKYKKLEKVKASQAELDAVMEEYKKARNNSINYYAGCKYSMINASKDPIYQLLMAHKHSGVLDKMDEIVKVNTPVLGADHYLIRLLKSRNAQVRQMDADQKAMTARTQYIDISIPDINGKTIKLSDVLKKNKYVLLEFWASWCGPCRHEIPNLKKAYELYHDKGFEIVSVSLDHDKDKWVKASEKENLQWINTCNLQAFDSDIVKKYAINGVPAAFLIDSKGKIVAHKPRGGKLQHILKELLK